MAAGRRRMNSFWFSDAERSSLKAYTHKQQKWAQQVVFIRLCICICIYVCIYVCIYLSLSSVIYHLFLIYAIISLSVHYTSIIYTSIYYMCMCTINYTCPCSYLLCHLSIHPFSIYLTNTHSSMIHPLICLLIIYQSVLICLSIYSSIIYHLFIFFLSTYNTNKHSHIHRHVRALTHHTWNI